MPAWYSGPDPLNLGGTTPESGGGAIPWANLSGEGRLYTGPGSGAAALDRHSGGGGLTAPLGKTDSADPGYQTDPPSNGGSGGGGGGVGPIVLYGALALGAVVLLGDR